MPVSQKEKEGGREGVQKQGGDAQLQNKNKQGMTNGGRLCVSGQEGTLLL